MSRYSDWFDSMTPAADSFASTEPFENPLHAKTHTGPRRPILPIPARSRTEIEKVVNRVCRVAGSGESKVIVFTSLESSSGCSWVCVHTGDLLAASTDASVCLVDANLRSPTLHTHMGVPNQSGLADLITNPSLRIKNVAATVHGTELCLLTSGSGSSEKTDGLVQTDRTRDRINELRSSFDVVLIDAPPVSICNDALSLGQSSDGMVLVLRAGVTRRDAARRLTDELCASGVKLIGAVLNDFSSPIPAAVEKWL